MEDLFAVGHSLITVEWDTIHGETEFSHFVLALREDRPARGEGVEAVAGVKRYPCPVARVQRGFPLTWATYQ